MQVLGAVLVRGDERQIHRGFHRAGQFNLGLLRCFFQPLQSHRIASKINSFGAFEFIGQEVNQDLVEIIAAEMGIAVDAEHFKDAVAHVQHRNVERSAAEVEDADLLILFLVKSIRQRCGCRFRQHA